MAWSGPLNINIDNVCSGSNAQLDTSTTPARTWGSVYPCYFNAGTITSVAIFGSAVAILVGLVIHFVLLGWAKGDDNTAWGLKMNKLSFLVRRGAVQLNTQILIYVLAFTTFWFIGLLIVFSSRQRSDATDGIRYAAGYLSAIILMLFACLIVFLNGSEAFTRAARAVLHPGGGVSGSLRTAYSHGIVASFLGVGLGVFGTCTYYLFMTLVRDRNVYSNYGNLCSKNGVFCGQTLAWQQLTGYAFGISTMTIFVRGMCGIFGKAAEVGSELLHKLEAQASADESRNPAAIADKVGAIAIDSVAMMLDLVDSYVIIIVSAGFLAQGHAARQAIPFWIAGGTFLSGLLSYGFVRCSNAGVQPVDRSRNMMWGLRIGMYLTAFLNLVWYAVILGILYTNYPARFGGINSGWLYFACLIIGNVASLFVWEFTSFFTSSSSSPTRSVAAAGITGASTMLIQGTGVGLLSLLPIALFLVGIIIACGAIAGQYGISLCALGFTSQLWFAIAANSIAPVAYSADGAIDQPEIAQFRQISVALHMAGESCAAETRGWSAVVAILASFSALAAFRQEAGLENWQQQGTESDVISEGIMYACALGGAFTPLFVAGINVLAVGKATRALVDETRRQFDHLQPGSGFNDCDPESIAKVTAYPSAMGAFLPAFIVTLLPMSFGFLIGPRALSCYVAGAAFSGGIMGLFFFNLSATFAKSKTTIEAEDAFGASGSDAHIASVIGTRLGNSLKDVAAPTMVTSIKTIAMTALLIAPLIFIDRTAPYFLTCLAKRWANPSYSILACFDWNKAYWSPLPLFFLALFSLIFYVAFWHRDGTPAPSKHEERAMYNVVDAGPQMMPPPMQATAQIPQQFVAMPNQFPPVPAPVFPQQGFNVQPLPFVQGPAYGEPYHAAPMHPEIAQVEHLIGRGYQIQ